MLAVPSSPVAEIVGQTVVDIVRFAAILLEPKHEVAAKTVAVEALRSHIICFGQCTLAV